MLENLEIFSGLTQEELQTFSIFCQERTYQPGEILFTKGEEATAMYVVVDGKLEVSDSDKILGYANSGDITGEMAIFGTKNIRSATVKALKQTKVIIVLKFSINELIQKHPVIYDKIKNIISDRLEENMG